MFSYYRTEFLKVLFSYNSLVQTTKAKRSQLKVVLGEEEEKHIIASRAGLIYRGGRLCEQKLERGDGNLLVQKGAKTWVKEKIPIKPRS